MFGLLNSVYSDYIVALKDGKVVREGPTDEMIHQDVLKGIDSRDIPAML